VHGGAERRFVSLESATARRNGAGFMPCQGLYYQPAGKRPTVAFIATHYNVDFSEHYLAEHMARRGYGFLGWNTRFRGNEAFFLLKPALEDIGAGVRWLKEEAAVERVVLLGNSGGGSLMGAYQSRSSDHGGQPPCDFYLSLNAHPGRPEVLTAWMDPSVTDEADPLATDASLSLYEPGNGPPYPQAFLTRYREAQRQRNQRITDWAVAELSRMASRGHSDRAFNLYRTWADPRMVDPDLDPSERPPRRCYAGDPQKANYSPRGIGLTSTCRTWLDMWSLSQSQCRGAPHLANVTVPSLVIQSMADTGVFPSDARLIHEALGAADKTLTFIAGDHYLLEPADARDAAADLIAGWLRPRL